MLKRDLPHLSEIRHEVPPPLCRIRLVLNGYYYLSFLFFVLVACTLEADMHFIEAHDRYGRPEGYSLESCKRLHKIAFDNVHANKPNCPEIVAVLPTIDSPCFGTVVFLAQNANIK